MNNLNMRLNYAERIVLYARKLNCRNACDQFSTTPFRGAANLLLNRATSL
jgi:hypothetical protein